MSIGTIGYTKYADYTANYIKKQTEETSHRTGFTDSVTKAEAAAKTPSAVNTGKTANSAVADYIRRHPEDKAHVEGQVRAGKKVLEKNGAMDISREDMTMEEYKAFFTALMDSIPFDASHRGDVT